jgi:hypothetical protein
MQLDLTGSTLRNVSLRDFDLPHSVMLDVVVVECDWPRQCGTTSLLGKYQPSPYLLRQPIQDLRGLSPLLRREIADAQYLAEMHAQPGGAIRNTWLRIWGASSAFGTSLTRLSLVAGSAMLLIALVILLIDKHLFVWPPDLKLIRDEFLIVGASLFGIGTSPQVTTGRDLLLPVARILGFIFLGLWIGVAANRLGRLSSE